MSRVEVLSLGGTVASTGSAAVPTLGSNELVEGLALPAGLEVRSTTLRRVPSSALDFDDLVDVATEVATRLATADGVVILSGTDTLEEWAFALDLLVGDQGRLVLTGAMRPPEVPGADGPANLLAALVTASSPASEGLGALVVMGGEVHAARSVRKVHSHLPHAFSSPDAGPLGAVVEGRLELIRRTAPLAWRPGMLSGPLPSIALLTSALGDDLRLIEDVPGRGYSGLVVEGFGAGNVTPSAARRLVTAAQALPVVLASKVLAGGVLEHSYGYEHAAPALVASGLASAGRLSGAKARVALACALGAGLDRSSALAAVTALGRT